MHSVLKILVNNKIDLQVEREITTDIGQRLADQIGANLYVETSALTGQGVKQLFNSMAEVIVTGGLISRSHDDSVDMHSERTRTCCTVV